MTRVAGIRPVGDCRLAFRNEGSEVVIYLASLSTMEGAFVLARLDKRALQMSSVLFDEIKAAYSKWMQMQLAELTGVVPDMVDQVPLEPREGNA